MWEYRSVSSTTVTIENLELRLNALGSVGWEAVGIASADKTLGLNNFTVILKREVVGWPAPANLAANWAADPTGRFPQRYWDGLRWTEHVVDSAGQRSSDWPNRRE